MSEYLALTCPECGSQAWTQEAVHRWYGTYRDETGLDWEQDKLLNDPPTYCEECEWEWDGRLWVERAGEVVLLA